MVCCFLEVLFIKHFFSAKAGDSGLAQVLLLGIFGCGFPPHPLSLSELTLLKVNLALVSADGVL